jgi:hypothetical protein
MGLGLVGNPAAHTGVLLPTWLPFLPQPAYMGTAPWLSQEDLKQFREPLRWSGNMASGV